MTSLLIAVLWLPAEARLWWSENGPNVTTGVYLDSVVYGDGSLSRWLALDELEMALDFPDDAAFTAARLGIIWGQE